jgi:hypothetical protein
LLKQALRPRRHAGRTPGDQTGIARRDRAGSGSSETTPKHPKRRPMHH